jgi:hypothetical protein
LAAARPAEFQEASDDIGNRAGHQGDSHSDDRRAHSVSKGTRRNGLYKPFGVTVVL